MPDFTKMHPQDVAALNTRAALDYFWGTDWANGKEYYTPARLAIYDEIAEYVGGGGSADNMAGLSICDACCGTGQMLDALRRVLTMPHALYGFDWSASAIDRCRRLLPDGTFWVANLHDVWIATQRQFELVLCIEALEHMDEPDRALHDLLRLVETGGALVASVPNGVYDSWHGHKNFWTPSEFEEWLIPHGLVDLRTIRHDRYLLGTLHV